MKSFLVIVSVFVFATNGITGVQLPTVRDVQVGIRNIQYGREIFQKVFKNADLEILESFNRNTKEIEHMCPGVSDKINDTLTEVLKCEKEINFNENTVCTTIKTSISKCSKPVRDLVTGCVSPKYKDLPLFIEKAIIGAVNQICDYTIEDVTELFNPCQFKKDYRTFPSCKSVEKILSQRSVPTTDIFCTFLDKAKTCSNDVHTFYCKNPITRNSFAKLHKSLKKETEEVCKNAKVNDVE